MEDTRQNSDPTSVQYYVISPQDKVRLKALLAPLPVREMEANFKRILNDLFMAKPNSFTAVDRFKFCIFKYALAYIRSDQKSAPESAARCEKYKEALTKHYESAQEKYKIIHAALIAPLTPTDLKNKIQIRNALDSIMMECRQRLTGIFADQIARIEAGIDPCDDKAQLKKLYANFHDNKREVIKAIGYKKEDAPTAQTSTLLQRLKPW